MSLLWEKRTGGRCYQVRRAGRTLRLYTDGVLHTQYHPDRLATGSVWDLLLLGALMTPPTRLRRVLVLGVGGGAVIRQLLAIFPDAVITGVELEAVHLAVARRFFGLRNARVRLLRDNAVTWLALREGQPFDLIIDDLFGERGGIPYRAVDADAHWFDLLASHLHHGGKLVMNFAGNDELRRCDWLAGGPSARRFRHALVLAHPSCENRVAVFGGADLSAAELAARVKGEPMLRRESLRWRARKRRNPLYSEG